MKNINSSTRISMLGILASIALLPGCGPESEDKNKSDIAAVEETTPEEATSADDIIASIDGKPLMIKQDFDTFIDQLEAAQPGSKMYLMQDPNAEESLINTLIDNKLLTEYWIKDEGIFDTPEYQKELEQYVKMCTMQLAQQKFEKKIIKDLKFDKAQAHKYYDKYKQYFLKESGGMQAQEVTFSDEKAAMEFLKKAKAPGANFATLAKEAEKEVTDLGTITDESTNVDDKIIKRVSKIAKAPAFDLIKVDDTFHIVNSTKKINADYHSLEDVQDSLKEMMMEEEGPQLINKKKEELRKKYNVEINEDFFKGKEGNMEQMLAALAQQTGMSLDDLKNSMCAAGQEDEDDNQMGEMNIPQSA